jgi:hypothetical protein
MKKFTFFCLALLALSFVSCGEEKSKQITPSSTEFKGGSLSDLVELVSADYTLNCDDITHINVQLRLKQSLPHFAELNINEIEFGGDPLTLNLYDAGGNEVEELELERSSYDTLKKLLQGNTGDVAEVVFSSGDEVELDKVASFTANDANGVFPMVYNLEGNIGRNQVVMTFVEYANNSIRGAYYYKRYEKMGAQAYLYLKGDRRDDNVLEIAEFNSDGYNSGSFVGKISNEGYKGEFVANMNLKTHIYDLKLNKELKPLDFSAVDFDYFDEYESHYDYIYGGGNSGNISEVLDEFEEYVDDYIKAVNKAANGDPTAALNVAELMSDAVELQEEINECQGTMSVGDLQRFQRINQKLMQAAQSL